MRIILALLLTSWLATLVGWIGSLRNLSSQTSTTEMLWNGFGIFDADNFTDDGRRWRRVFFAGWAVFFVSAAAAMIAR